jgi:hypothetical protein
VLGSCTRSVYDFAVTPRLAESLVGWSCCEADRPTKISRAP